MMFKETSRKDDLVSLCYVMFTLLNGKSFPILEDNAKFDGYNSNDTPYETKQKFEKIKEFKKKKTLYRLA